MKTLEKNYSSSRLMLDELAINDAAFIQELVNTKEWVQFIGERNVHSLEDAQAYIKKILANDAIAYQVARLKDGSVPIGIITFIKRHYLQHHDIGFAFLPAYSKKGYAYEASKIILDDALGKPMHPVILATTLSENKNSIQLLLKLGLHFEKEIEVDHTKLLLYST